jgi:hypothetical protein
MWEKLPAIRELSTIAYVGYPIPGSQQQHKILCKSQVCVQIPKNIGSRIRLLALRSSPCLFVLQQMMGDSITVCDGADCSRTSEEHYLHNRGGYQSS